MTDWEDYRSPENLSLSLQYCYASLLLLFFSVGITITFIAILYDYFLKYQPLEGSFAISRDIIRP